jgi:hypothetical protein
MINLAQNLSQLISEAVRIKMTEVTLNFSINAEKGKDWQYASPTAITLWNKFKSSGGLG